MAPKPRSADDQWMPSRVYRGKAAYEWHPKGGGAVRLCALDAKQSEVWAAYEKAVATDQVRFDFSKLADMYFASANFTGLKPNTRKDYEFGYNELKQVFGAMAPNAIKPEDVRRYMDLRGQTSRVRANRERSLLSTIMAWGYERGLVKVNPCTGVKTFREERRERYVTDTEYQAVFSIAPPMVRVAMEIAYRCAARQQDVLSCQRQHIQVDGIFIRQGKTGKQQIKMWTVELRATIDLALSQPSKHLTMYVIHTTTGMRYTRDGFNTIWGRVIKSALAQQLIAEPFTFHDLKRKGISDFEGDKQKFSGHMTRAMAERYNVRPDVVETIGTRIIDSQK